MNHIGSMYSLFFSEKKVIDFETAKSCDTDLFSTYFRKMLERGIYLAPSQFESLFISIPIEDHVDQILSANKQALKFVASNN